jgi:3-deoxy-D-manno-octulosonic-acid transferase
MIFIYTLVLWLLLPYIFFHLIWRARKQPEYLHHIGERFGHYATRSSKPVIWLHAVSVGETRALQSLVSRLSTSYPDHQILLTHTTPTGRAASKQLYGDDVMRVYLPYDYPFAVQRFLNHFQPQLGILMETEIWINLIDACHKRRIPLLLINARMSEKSMRRYSRFANLSGIALTELSAIAAQTADDASRLTRLGAKNVSVMGNLKFDIEPPSVMLDLGKNLRRQFGDTRPVLLAASTREGEEELLLDALQYIHIPNLLVIIVPRHPQRFSIVAALLERRGISFQRRSENLDVPMEKKIILGNSMGEMLAYYAASDIAYIGGSLLPYGGQNLIEACAVGTPVLVGPHMYNFAEATQLAISAGAAIKVSNATELATEALRLLRDTVAMHEMRRQCIQFVSSNRGATEKSLRLIVRYLENSIADSTPFS